MRTGDAAYRDPDGYVYIYDRVKDMIVTGGENVYPAEVENAIVGHPDVADVAVIGVPDEQMGRDGQGHRGREARRAARPGGVIAWSRERIAGYKVPQVRRFRRSDPAQHHRQDPAARVAKAVLGGAGSDGQLRASGSAQRHSRKGRRRARLCAIRSCARPHP